MVGDQKVVGKSVEKVNKHHPPAPAAPQCDDHPMTNIVVLPHHCSQSGVGAKPEPPGNSSNRANRNKIGGYPSASKEQLNVFAVHMMKPVRIAALCSPSSIFQPSGCPGEWPVHVLGPSARS